MLGRPPDEPRCVKVGWFIVGVYCHWLFGWCRYTHRGSAAVQGPKARAVPSAVVPIQPPPLLSLMVPPAFTVNAWYTFSWLIPNSQYHVCSGVVSPTFPTAVLLLVCSTACGLSCNCWPCCCSRFSWMPLTRYRPSSCARIA
jgi:hypothetical protein